MEVKVDEMELKKAGYIDANQYNHVALSFNLVAKMLGVSVSTVAIYANAGFIPVDNDDKVSMADALKLDFKELHRAYIQSRNFVRKTKKTRK